VGPLDALWHVLNLILPGIVLGMLSAAGAKLLWRRELAGVAWKRLARDASLACVAVLVAGLVAFRHDGRMATYAAMVLACALMLWWRGFGPGKR